MLTIQFIFFNKKTLDKLSKLITICQLNHDYENMNLEKYQYRNNKKTITRIFKSYEFSKANATDYILQKKKTMMY